MTVRWYHGMRYVVKTKKKTTYRWTNRWLSHPCKDLALPFELGSRAAHHG